MRRVRCPRQEEVVHSLPGSTSVRVNPWSVRVVHCLASHAVTAPRPTWEVRELVCVKLFFAHVCCAWVYVFPHSLPTASVSHRDLAQRLVLQQLTLMCWDSGTTALRPCVPSPNMAHQYTPRCLSNPAALGSFAHDLQHRLTPWTKHKPIALLRCFTNAHDGNTNICLNVSDMKLATISQTKTMHRIVCRRRELHWCHRRVICDTLIKTSWENACTRARVHHQVCFI